MSSNDRCSYSDWCPLPAEGDGSLCILHEPKETKNLEIFNDTLRQVSEQRLLPNWLEFNHVVFPKGFDWQKANVPPAERIDFNGAIFHGDTSFANVSFQGEINFAEVTFKGDVTFAGSTFATDVLFRQAVFDGECSFQSATFKGTAGYYFAKFQRSVNFTEAKFTGDNFAGPKREGDAAFWFHEATFQGAANFNSAVFGQRVNFVLAKFAGLASFDSAKFQKEADFVGAVFTEQSGRFSVNKFGIWDSVKFTSAEFGGDVSFSSVHFMTEVDFTQATFAERLSLYEGDLEKRAKFGGTTFIGPARFDYATFRNGASFAGASFRNNASFSHTNFYAEVSFYGVVTTSGEESWTVRPAIFYAEADFDSATFHGLADFELATFKEGGLFASARFRGRAEFKGAFFGGEGDFTSATFSAKARFENNRFRGKADFNGAAFEESVVFREPLFESGATFLESTFRNALQFTGTPLELRFEKVILSMPDQVQFDRVNPSKTSFIGSNVSHVQFSSVEWASKKQSRWPGSFKHNSHVIYDHLQLQSAKDAGASVTEIGALAHEVGAVYRNLRLSLENSRQEVEASDFFIGQMDMKLMDPMVPYRDKVVLRLFRLVALYGESYFRPLAAYFFLSFILAFVYLWGGFFWNGESVHYNRVDPSQGFPFVDYMRAWFIASTAGALIGEAGPEVISPWLLIVRYFNMLTDILLLGLVLIALGRHHRR